MKAIVLFVCLAALFGTPALAKEIPLPRPPEEATLKHLLRQEDLCAHIETWVRANGVAKTVQFIKDSARNEDKACSIVLARVELALNGTERAREWFIYSLVFIRHSWGRMRAEALYYAIALSAEVDLDMVKELKNLAPKAAKQLGF